MFFNQHSYLISGLFLLAVVAFLVLREGVTNAGLLAIGLTAGLLAGVWLATRTGPSTYDEVAEVEAALSEGPTLIEFYSNY